MADTTPKPTLARGDGQSFALETIAEAGEAPVLALAPDRTAWMAVSSSEATQTSFRLGPEEAGGFALAEVEDVFAPSGTRFQIDASGHHHLLWGASGSSRIPPVKYSYATDASGEFVVTEFDEQCFRRNAALHLDGDDVHLAYVRPRNLQAVYYKPADSNAPSPFIDDARGGLSDTPADVGVALAVHKGVVRLAYETNDAIFLASRLGDGFSSTLVEERGESRAFASPALVSAKEGLHLFYFAASTDDSDDIQLKHALLPNDAAVGCQE
jgi:hypothetical protein